MALKCCLTVMNAPKHKEEEKVVFNNKRGPKLITISDKYGRPLLVRVSVSGMTDDPLLRDAFRCESGSCSDFDSWIPDGQKTRPFYEDDDIWGINWGVGLMSNTRVDSGIPFLQSIDKKYIKKTVAYK
jgi:hypothetical protein